MLSSGKIRARADGALIIIFAIPGGQCQPVGGVMASLIQNGAA